MYLVDSAGVNLPFQDGIFPGQYGAARIFYYNSLMRRKLKIPQIAAVMGPCIAGGAYLPALSDVIIMVEKTSFMGLGGPNLVKGAVGQVIDAEALGGAQLHTSSAAWRITWRSDDGECLEMIRQQFRQIAARRSLYHKAALPAKLAEGLYDLLPADHRLPYQMEDVIARFSTATIIWNFNPITRRRCCARTARLDGRPIGVIANRRGFLKTHGKPRIGGIVYAESARKISLFCRECGAAAACRCFICRTSRDSWWALEAESEGIIRAGAEMVETMACATVPKIILTLNHASGAGYYAMAGQGFDPNFTFAGRRRGSASWKATRPFRRSTGPNSPP